LRGGKEVGPTQLKKGEGLNLSLVHKKGSGRNIWEIARASSWKIGEGNFRNKMFLN